MGRLEELRELERVMFESKYIFSMYELEVEGGLRGDCIVCEHSRGVVVDDEVLLYCPLEICKFEPVEAAEVRVMCRVCGEEFRDIREAGSHAAREHSLRYDSVRVEEVGL